MNRSVLVGVTDAASEHAVYVCTSGGGDDLIVDSFTREGPGKYEWANLMIAPASILSRNDGYVFQALEPLLPLAACVVDLAEIDTERDLVNAREAVSRWNTVPFS